MRTAAAVSLVALAVVVGFVLGDSAASSQTQSPAVQITDVQQQVNDVVVVRTGEDDLVMVYSDGPSGARDVFARRSPDNGRTWTAPENLSDDADTHDSSEVTVASAGNEVFVAWSVGGEFIPEVRFTRSEDEGETWADPTAATDFRGGTTPHLAAVAGAGADPPAVYLVYRTELNGNIYGNAFARRSVDRGDSWEEPVLVKDLSVTDSRVVATRDRILVPYFTGFGIGSVSFLPDLTDPIRADFDIHGASFDLRTNSNGDAFVTGHGNVAGTFGIFTTASPDGGLTWTPLALIHQFGPGVGVGIVSSFAASERLHVVWNEVDIEDLSSTIYHRSKGVAAGDLSAITPLSGDAYQALVPDVTVNGDNLYVVWSETAPGNPAPTSEHGAIRLEDGSNAFDSFDLRDVDEYGPFAAKFVLNDGASQLAAESSESMRSPYFHLTFLGDKGGVSQLYFSLGHVTGDATCDAQVTMPDLMALLRDEAGLPTDAKCMAATDVDCDSERTTADLQLLLAHVGGIEQELAADCSPIDF